MKRKELIYLHDIKLFCERITQYTDNMKEIEWLDATQKQDAVERNFEKIGEALKRLHRLDPDLAKRIPRVPKIISFRNVLIHEYPTLDQGTVWAIIKNNLPKLYTSVCEILVEIEQGD